MPKAFLFNADAWLTDQRIQAMSFQQRGVFMTLICYCMRAGSLPHTPVEIGLKIGLTRRSMHTFGNDWKEHFNAFFRLDTSEYEPRWVIDITGGDVAAPISGDEPFHFNAFEMNKMSRQQPIGV